MHFEIEISCLAAGRRNWLGALFLVGVCLHGGGTLAAQEPDLDSLLDGQPKHWYQRQWTVDDGLPVNALSDLAVTPDGWLWIASFDGLLRFDGHEFERFDSVREPELRSNRIEQLEVGGDGTLWILSETGHLTRFRDGRFTAVTASEASTGGSVEPVAALDLTSDQAGQVWVATKNGILRVDDERLLPGVPELDGTRVDTLVAAGSRVPEGTRLWWVTHDRRLGTRDALGVRWLDSPEIRSIVGDPSRLVLDATVGADGSLWLGSSHGLFRVPPNRPLERVRPGVGGCPVPGIVWVEAARRRYCTRDAEGAIWSIDGDRVWRDHEQLFRLPTPPPSGFMALVLDHEGTAWFAANDSGLYNLAPPRVRVLGPSQGLASRNLYAVVQDRQGVVWLGDWRGTLSRVAGDRILELPSPASPDDIVHSIYHDPVTGGLLFGSRNGLFVLETSGRIPAVEAGFARRRLSDPLRAGTPPGARINVILRLGDGRLLLGTKRGVWISRPGDPQRPEVDLPAGETVLRSDAWAGAWIDELGQWPIRAAVEEADGSVWIATAGGGLARWSGQASQSEDRVEWWTVEQGLPSNLLRSLYRDAEENLWIGTEDRGLARLRLADAEDGAAPAIDSIDHRDGLWDDGIHRILEDEQGRLWMSTNRGLFHVARDQLDAYFAGGVVVVDSVGLTEADGMVNREGNGGSQDAGLRARDGTLWFPTQNGVVVVDPSRFATGTASVAPESSVRARQPPPVFVQGISSGGEFLRSASDVVALRPDQRTFEVSYTALGFRAPERSRFRYRLRNYDADWVDAGIRRRAFYTRVAPGRYTFQVQARSGDGVWNRAGAALELRIEPYLWEAAWVRGLAVLTLVALAFAAARARERHQLRRRQQLEDLVARRTDELAQERDTVRRQAEELVQLDRQKSRLFADLSHELRTPLTLTLGPLEDMRDGRFGSLRPELEAELTRTHGNAARLLELVNQLLDVSRLEAGGLELRIEPCELGSTVRRLADRFISLAERRGVDFDVWVPTESLQVHLDPEQLDKIFSNLLSNAFKFTPRGGRVEVSVTASEDWVRIQVGDTGPGIPERDLPHIFDRYYQAGSTTAGRLGATPAPGSSQLGTGLGLSLVRDLVELHKGRVEVITREGEGAIFQVLLRRGRDHFSTSQLAYPEEQPASVSETKLATEPPAARTSGAGNLSALTTAVVPESGVDIELPEPGQLGAEDRTTVLVVDDHPDLRRYVRRHLADRYRVLEAADATTALELACAHMPDLLVSDVMMPPRLEPPAPPGAPEDGFQLCQAVKRNPELDWMPVILLTARATSDDKLAGLGEGADDYLTKPFDVRELVARVENLIASRHKLRQRFLDGEQRLPEARLAQSALPVASGVFATPDDRRWLERVRETMEQGLDEEDFGIGVLAERLHLHRGQLHRRLKELTGQSPSQLLMHLRLQRSAALLRSEVGSVAEIGYAVGFESAAHFSRRFKERFGVTPSAFQRGAVGSPPGFGKQERPN